MKMNKERINKLAVILCRFYWIGRFQESSFNHASSEAQRAMVDAAAKAEVNNGTNYWYNTAVDAANEL